MKNKLALLCGVMVTFASFQSQAGFVKYKDYLIPVGGACEASAIPASAPNPIDSGKARVFITTDVGGGDPDDKQSLAHILAFADKVDIEGFATSDPNRSDSINTGVAFIKSAITAYSQDLPRLRQASGAGAFPDPNVLKQQVYKGSTVIGNQNGGWGESAGADAIVKAVRCAYRQGNRKPLYVLTWGTSSEAVRALEKAPDIVKYLRVVSYSDHNNENRQAPVNDYLKNVAKSKALWWIDYPVNTSSIRPLQLHDRDDTNGYINSIISKGYLGRVIEKNGPPTDQYTGFKLGDTITTMFVFNSASQRSNPSVTTWGNYSKSNSIGVNYWKLKIEVFKDRNSVYSTWKDRVSVLVNN